MNRVRLGAVEYLNARPLIVGLPDELFDVRLDTPSQCAELLHAGQTDLGLIPSIEYLRAPAGQQYRIVPDVAIGSFGPVASVALYTTRPVGDIRSIALDTSSRTSIALTRVLCQKVFRMSPLLESQGPDLEAMLDRCDAGLLIGDRALLTEGGPMRVGGREVDVEKVDLGRVWSEHTGLPFVYACWVGRPGAIGGEHVRQLQRVRDRAVAAPEAVAAAYFADQPEHVARGTRYLQDNIRYVLGPAERDGLERFYRYAAEVGVVPTADPLRFFECTPR